MGYYDFDEHFWAAHEVCGQQTEIVAPKMRFLTLRKLFSWLVKQDSSKDELKPHQALTPEHKSPPPPNSGIPSD